MDDLLLVGRVARAHGNRGHVIVNPETDFLEERFALGSRAAGWTGSNGPDGSSRCGFTRDVRSCGFAGVETIDAAEELAGAELKMAASEIAPLPDGTFYRHDLIGCDVADARRASTSARVTAVEGSIERS